MPSCMYIVNIYWIWTYSTYRTLATYLPTFFRWIKKTKRRGKKNIEVITPTENHVYAKFLFSQYQMVIINDDMAKSRKRNTTM